jgi:hypothetical protein
MPTYDRIIRYQQLSQLPIGNSVRFRRGKRDNQDYDAPGDLGRYIIASSLWFKNELMPKHTRDKDITKLVTNKRITRLITRINITRINITRINKLTTRINKLTTRLITELITRINKLTTRTFMINYLICPWDIYFDE